jgi:hypothetical protein
MSRKKRMARYTHNEYLQFVHDWREASMDQWPPEERAAWEALPQDNSEASIEAKIRFFQRRRLQEECSRVGARGLWLQRS